VAGYIYWRQLAAATSSEAQADQIVLGLIEQTTKDFDRRVGGSSEGDLVVKLPPHLTDEPYTWHTQSALAVWKYSAGRLSPATMDDLEQANRVGDVSIWYFSLQSVSAAEIVVGIADYYPFIDFMSSSDIFPGGSGWTWRLAKSEGGWEIAANEDESNWDMVAVP
jgi:hypothetical protein